MARLVALLRGINLGSKRLVKMGDLKALMEEQGYTDVRTVLRSGNVVYTGEPDRDGLERALEERFGFRIDVVLRTMDELRAASEHDPFADVATDLSRSFVTFLPEPPDTSVLDGQDFAPEQWAAHGRELYVWCPDGVQDSRIMKLLGKGLGTTATTRNLATVRKLLD
jgi:uncharacterized protein (DUF1697 family)